MPRITSGRDDNGEDMHVCQLFWEDGCEWDKVKVASLFSKAETVRICQIPLDQSWHSVLLKMVYTAK